MIDQKKPFHIVKRVVINGTPTDIVFHKFVNKVFLLITQYEKITNTYVVEAKKDFNLHNPERNIIHKFGYESDEIGAAVLNVVSNLPPKLAQEEILLSLGLKEIDAKVLKELSHTLMEIL